MKVRKRDSYRGLFSRKKRIRRKVSKRLNQEFYRMFPKGTDSLPAVEWKDL